MTKERWNKRASDKLTKVPEGAISLRVERGRGKGNEGEMRDSTKYGRKNE